MLIDNPVFEIVYVFVSTFVLKAWVRENKITSIISLILAVHKVSFSSSAVRKVSF